MATAATLLLIAVVVVVATIGKDGVVSAFNPNTGDDESSSAAAANPSPPQPKPAVPVASLGALLLTANEVEAATGWPAARVATPTKTFHRLATGTPGERCQAPLTAAHSRSYRGTGYTAVRHQSINAGPSAEPQRWDWIFQDSLAAFPAAADATRMVESAKKSWQQCVNQTIKTHTKTDDGGYDTYWALRSLSVDDGVLFMPKVQEAGEGWVCWHALGARNNIVIDLMACSTGATKADAQSAYDAIAAKVDAAT